MNYAWARHSARHACLRYHVRVHIVSLCVFVQADRLRDPPLLRPQYDGPRGPAHCFVPRGLLHYGWHRRGNLPGALPHGGVDGSAWRAAHLHDHNGPGITATAGFTQLWVITRRNRPDCKLFDNRRSHWCTCQTLGCSTALTVQFIMRKSQSHLSIKICHNLWTLMSDRSKTKSRFLIRCHCWSCLKPPVRFHQLLLAR